MTETQQIFTRNKQEAKFLDYEQFVDKFQPKKTTDDCYTPPNVYQVVLDYVLEKCNLGTTEEVTVIRPFYPGGDFEAYDYPPNCVVIDNPPFSILAKIVRFYQARNIKFFLFAPHLTCFNASTDATYVIANAQITYQNGAIIATSFLSNLFGLQRIIGCPDLYYKLRALKQFKQNQKYTYPDELITVSKISNLIKQGIAISFSNCELQKIDRLDSQRQQKKSIYGAGFLLSKSATARMQQAEQAAKQPKATKLDSIGDAEGDRIVWSLSERERAIIDALG